MGNTSSGGDVKLLAEIGRGSYAVVYRAVWAKKPVAAKKLHPYLFEKRDIAKKFREEWEILSRLNHENVVRFLTVVLPQTVNPEPDDTPIIITELLEQDLGRFIRNSKKTPKVTFNTAVSLMFDVAKGLNYLHQPPRKIAHRDLASKNILLTSTGQAKIADFGFAKAFPEGEMIASANPGTSVYRAPETFGSCGWGRKAKYSLKSDVFSFGIVLLEVTVGQISLVLADLRTEDGTILSEDYRRSKDLDKMGHDHPLRPLVMACISNNPQERPDASELVNVLRSFKEQNASMRSLDDLEGSGKFVYRVPADQYDYEFKIMIVGETAVGKTSIVNKFVNPNRPFQERLPVTMQFGEFHERLNLKGKTVLLHLFDTSGELNVHSVLPQLYRGAHGAVVVFDVGSWDSLVKVRRWISIVRDKCGSDVPVILAGNKADQKRREVDIQTAERVCNEFKLFYIEVSAKTGQNIDETFSVLTEQLMQQKRMKCELYEGEFSNSSNSQHVEAPLLGFPRTPSVTASPIIDRAPSQHRKLERDPDSITLEAGGLGGRPQEQKRRPCC